MVQELALGALLGLGSIGGLVGYGVVNSYPANNRVDTFRQMQSIEQSLHRYAAKHHGVYPSTDQGLQAAKREFADERIPTDAWGNAFVYISPGPKTLPVMLISLGADGAPGGSGVDADMGSWERGW